MNPIINNDIFIICYTCGNQIELAANLIKLQEHLLGVIGWKDPNPHHCQVKSPFSIFSTFTKLLRFSTPSDA